MVGGRRARVVNDPQGRVRRRQIGIGVLRGQQAVATAGVDGHGLIRRVVAAAVQVHLDRIATHIVGIGLFGIGPDVAVAGEVGPQVIEGLPGQHDGAILGAVEEGPVHGLGLADDLGGGQQVFDDGLGGQCDGWRWMAMDSKRDAEKCGSTRRSLGSQAGPAESA